MNRCKTCGACQECGAKPAPVTYPYVRPYVNPYAQPYAWPYVQGGSTSAPKGYFGTPINLC